MTQQITKLTVLAGDALSDSTPRLDERCTALAGDLARQVLQLLWSKNGFYAFESSLHVFPVTDSSVVVGMAQWNTSAVWRFSYGELAEGCLFFAEDAVGGQFCVFDNAVYKFEPETADRAFVAESIDEWAGAILKDYRSHLLWPLAHEWQQVNGPLPAGQRLIPKLPFSLGGAYDASNLHAVDATNAMRFYGDLATQIQGLPDGTQVRLKAVE